MTQHLKMQPIKFDPNFTKKVMKAKPYANLQLHMSFVNNLQTNQNQRFVFTDAYVSKVLDNITKTNKMTGYETYRCNLSSSMIANLTETLM